MGMPVKILVKSRNRSCFRTALHYAAPGINAYTGRKAAALEEQGKHDPPVSA